MTSTTSTSHARSGYRPPGEHSLKPYLVVDGARAAIDWYQDVFGAVVTTSRSSWRTTESVTSSSPSTAPRSRLADEFPEMDILGPIARGRVGGLADLVRPRRRRHVRPRRRAWRVRRAGAGRPVLRIAVREYYVRSATAGASRCTSATTPSGRPLPPGRPRPRTCGTRWATTSSTSRSSSRPARSGAACSAGSSPSPRPASEGTGEYAHVENSTVPFGVHGGSGNPVDLGSLHPGARPAGGGGQGPRAGGTVESEEYGYESGSNAVCLDDQGTRFELGQPAEGY